MPSEPLPDDSAPVDSVQAPPPTLWQRPAALLRWAKASRRNALLAGGGALAAIAVAAAAVGLAIVGRKPPEKPVTLDMGLEALARADYTAACAIADKLIKQLKPSAAMVAGCELIRGAALAHDADVTFGESRSKSFLLAASHLKVAQEKGFPPGYAAQGLFWLAKSLYCSGQVAESRPLLREALRSNPERQAELCYFLAGAYLDGPRAQLPDALEENKRAQAAAASPEEQTQCHIQRAQILVAMDRPADATAVLDRLPAAAKDSPMALLLRGQMILRQADEMKRGPAAADPAKVQSLCQEAIKLLRTAQGHDTLTMRVTSKAMYLIGMGFLESDDSRAALDQFVRTQSQSPGTAESLAAAMDEADLQRQLGHDAEAVAGYCRILESVRNAAEYANPWLTLEQMRTRMLSAYQHYLEAKAFARAAELTARFSPLFPRERAVELAAETYQAWGRSLTDQAERQPSQGETLRRQARRQFQLAGRCHAELAQVLLLTNRYPDELWSSIQAYLEGHDYHAAILALQEYLKNESRQRHADALTALGEALLCEGRIDEALAALADCTDQHPRDAAAYRARLLAARAFAEKGDFRRAESALHDNLNTEALSPASVEWRESLFDLGRLLHDQGRYDEALPRLEEALARYPDVPRAVETRYLLFDSCRQVAAAVRQSLKNVVAENSRTVRLRRVQQALESALAQAQKLCDLLAHREPGRLTPPESMILRNCFFGVGDVLFEIQRYEEAVKAYQAAINRYGNSPESLFAYTQIVQAWQRLHKPQEARDALQEARAMFGRLPAATPFGETTIYSRQEWADLLQQLGNS